MKGAKCETKGKGEECGTVADRHEKHNNTEHVQQSIVFDRDGLWTSCLRCLDSISSKSFDFFSSSLNVVDASVWMESCLCEQCISFK